VNIRVGQANFTDFSLKKNKRLNFYFLFFVIFFFFCKIVSSLKLCLKLNEMLRQHQSNVDMCLMIN
jgi:hypothetical protein